MRQLNIDGTASPASVAQAPLVAPAFKLDAVRSVRMHLRLALAVAAAVFVIIVGYALTRKPMYEAESLIYVEPLATKVMNDGSPGFYDPSRYDSYLEQQIQTAQRDDILQAAVEKLPPGVWRYPNESVAGAAARLGAVVQVKRVGTSYQLSVSATGADPVGTAAAVNAVTDAYLEQGSRDEHAISDGRIQLLTEERQRLQQELQDAQTEQTSLSAALGMANPAAKDTGNPYDAQLGGVRAELAAAREAHDVAAAQLSSMTAQNGLQSPGIVAAADELIASDAGLSSMKVSISTRRASLQSQMAGLTPSNPIYKQDQAEIAAVDRDMDAMTAQLREKAERRLQDKLRQDLQRTGDVEARLNGELAHDTAMATSAAPKLQRASELAGDVTRLQTSLAGVDDSLRALQLETHGPGLAHLSVAAAVPVAPVASRKGQLLLAAFPLALLAGIAAAVLAHKRDPHAYVGADVQRALGFAPMAVMPAAHEVSDAVMEEYLLRLAAGLERAYKAHGARSFVFTAVSATTDMSGLVHDVQRKLGELGFAVMALDVDNVLRPGKQPEVQMRQDRVGFASAQLERLKAEHDLLLIETRPLLLSAESEYAVCSTDGVVLVAQSGVTTCKELKEAAELLERLHARGVAVVLQELHLAYAEPQFRAAVDELEKNSHLLRRSPAREAEVVSEAREGLPEHVIAKQPESTVVQQLVVVPVSVQDIEEPVVLQAPVAAEPAMLQDQFTVQEAAADYEPEMELPEIRLREPVTTEQRIETGEQNSRPIVESMESAAPGPLSEARLATRWSAMTNADEFDAPKRNVFERIFKRFHEPAVSILPDESDSHAGREEIDFHETSPVETQPQPHAIFAEIHAANIMEPQRAKTNIEQEPIDAVPETVGVAEVDGRDAPAVTVEEVSPTNPSATFDEAVLPQTVAMATAGVDALPPVSSEIESIETAQDGPRTIAFNEVIELPVVNLGETFGPRVTPPPTMRQWEFRQARKMREVAAAELQSRAKSVEDMTGSRRGSRPGLMSATGKRTSIEDTFVPSVPPNWAPKSASNSALPVGQPRLVKKWTETTDDVPAQTPARRWGMLSRFDQRFENETPGPDTGEALDEEPELIAYGRVANGHGARQR